MANREADLASTLDLRDVSASCTNAVSLRFYRTYDSILPSLLITSLDHNMNPSRFAIRAFARQSVVVLNKRPLSVSSRAFFKAETDAVSTQTEATDRQHSNIDEWRESQKDRPLNPHMTNTNSAIHNDKEMPSVGADRPPPEFISKVDGNYQPKDSHPENTERMTGGTQAGDPDKVSQSNSASPGEFGVGEMEGAEFRIEPIERKGEDVPTMRARLLCS